MKIKKGDLVKVIAGSKEKKGKIGRVVSVDLTSERVMVEGVGMHKKHLKPQRNPKHPEGGVIELPRSMHVSNVMLMAESLGRPVRAGTRMTDDGKRVRVARGRGVKADLI